MINPKIKTYLDRLAGSAKRPNSYFVCRSGENGKNGSGGIFCFKRWPGKSEDAEFLRRVREKIHPDVVVIEPEIVEDKKGRFAKKKLSSNKSATRGSA